MIPTAEEFCNDMRYVTYSLDEKLITFAKMHVEEALKQASEQVYVSDTVFCEIDRDSILNAYPLENIK
jgi:hypothetical protein